MSSPRIPGILHWALPVLFAACLLPARALAAADGTAVWDPCRTFIAEPADGARPLAFPVIRAGKRGVEVIVGLAPAGNREAERVSRDVGAGARSIVFLPSGRHVEVAGLEEGRLVLTAYTPERADAILKLLCFERAGSAARTAAQGGRKGP